MNEEESQDKVSLHIRQVCADDFDEILKINAESAPHVAKLEAEDLRRLVALASFALVASDGVHVVGYALAFLSSDVYEGDEFQSFRARFVEPFLYIDQVAVCPTARRANIASQMYAWLQQRSRELGISTLCCGVNLRPANPVSMWFHRKLGFESVGDLETRDGLLVALLRNEALPSAFRAITKTNEQDLPRLFEVWESSVRASHSFLTEVDIQSLIPLVKHELADFKPIYCLRAGDGNLFAFLGVAGFKIEMLFVHPGNRGSGAGRLLSEFAIKVLHASSVDVNEQNYQAIGFYRHLGFRRTGRSPLDPAGESISDLASGIAASATSPSDCQAGQRSGANSDDVLSWPGSTSCRQLRRPRWDSMASCSEWPVRVITSNSRIAEPIRSFRHPRART